MKRVMIGLATAAGLCLYTGFASSDPGGYMMPSGSGASSLPSWAQVAGPNTLLGAGDLPPGRPPDKYGLHPCLKKLFHIPVANGPRVPGYGATGYNPLTNPANWAAGGYGMGGPALSPNGFPPGAYGPASGGPPAGCANCQAGPYQQYPQPYGPMMQGTLAFPHNSFVRSPRDYFMVDVNK
ncbi:MAG TPA: hypothetical protein VG122_21850 [Gemmata sp.]|jgi:hypothetical protein|nr:hypothetical protein [Gemmata sp.]